MHQFMLSLNKVFSDAEKMDCLPIVYELIDLAIFAKENGILALENEIKDDKFMEIGIMLMVNGAHNEILEKAFKYAILSKQYTGKELLSRLLKAQGLLLISDGYHDYDCVFISYVLCAMLGEDYLPQITAYINKIRDTIDVEAILEEHTTFLEESRYFETRLQELTRIELSQLLIPNQQVITAMAFRGCSKSFVKNMSHAISKSSFEQICKLISLTPLNKNEVLEHQKIILDRIPYIPTFDVTE